MKRVLVAFLLMAMVSIGAFAGADPDKVNGKVFVSQNYEEDNTGFIVSLDNMEIYILDLSKVFAGEPYEDCIVGTFEVWISEDGHLCYVNNDDRTIRIWFITYKDETPSEATLKMGGNKFKFYGIKDWRGKYWCGITRTFSYWGNKWIEKNLQTI